MGCLAHRGGEQRALIRCLTNGGREHQVLIGCLAHRGGGAHPDLTGHLAHGGQQCYRGGVLLEIGGHLECRLLRRGGLHRAGGIHLLEVGGHLECRLLQRGGLHQAGGIHRTCLVGVLGGLGPLCGPYGTQRTRPLRVQAGFRLECGLLCGVTAGTGHHQCPLGAHPGSRLGCGQECPIGVHPWGRLECGLEVATGILKPRWNQTQISCVSHESK